MSEQPPPEEPQTEPQEEPQREPVTEPGRGQEPPPEPSPEDPVLDTGQEEVFSRAEVELGRIEHSAGPGRQAQARTPDNHGPSAG